jgi:hypothetical protein
MMQKVSGYHAMMQRLNGIRNIKENRIQKGNQVFVEYSKGKSLLAYSIISLVNARLNEYFIKPKF